MDIRKGEILIGYSVNNSSKIKQIRTYGLPYIEGKGGDDDNIFMGYSNESTENKKYTDEALPINKQTTTNVSNSKFSRITIRNLNRNFYPIGSSVFYKNYDDASNINSKSFTFLNIYGSGRGFSTTINYNDGNSSLILDNFIQQIIGSGTKSNFLRIAADSKNKTNSDIIYFIKIVILYTTENTENYSENYSYDLINSNHIGIY